MPKYVCKICGEEFGTDRGLKGSHMTKKHEMNLSYALNYGLAEKVK